MTLFGTWFVTLLGGGTDCNAALMNRRSLSLGLGISGAALALFLVAFGAVGTALHEFRSSTKHQWDQVAIGDNEEAVKAKLGSPFREYSRDSAPIDYYIPGYRRRERQITNRVLIYMGADMVLYLWIDRNGRVEDMFSGVS